MAWTVEGAAGNILSVDLDAPANALSVDADGHVTKPTNCYVFALNSVTDSDVTGNSGSYTLGLDTELFDSGNNFSANTFTAPVTGKYLVHCKVEVSGVTAAGTVYVSAVTSNRTYRLSYLEDAHVGQGTYGGSAIVDMDAGDTLTFTVTGTGEASNVMDIVGNSSPITFACVQLVQ